MYKIEYRKTKNRTLPIAEIRGRNNKDGSIKITRIVLNPILKQKENAKIRKVIVSHEVIEAKLQSRGVSESKAHKYAMSKEPKWFKKINTHRKLTKAVGL